MAERNARPQRPGRDRPGRPGRRDSREVASREGEDVEQIAAEDASEMLTAFRTAARREDQRFLDATDSEYWVAVCFQTREQKEEFLRKAGIDHLGDKYVDGMKVAQKLGITLESRVPTLPNLRIDRRLNELT